MRHSLVNAAIVPFLFIQVGHATADQLLTPATFQQDLRNRAKAAADIIFGLPTFKGAHNGGTNGPCHDPKATAADYYCVKVTIDQSPYIFAQFRNGEINYGLQGTPSFQKMDNDITQKGAEKEFARLESVVTDSWTIPIFAAWSDGHAAVDAVNNRINVLEAKLPEITAENTKDLFTKIQELEKKISALEGRLAELEKK
jgi:hypothetical protein